MRDEMVLIVTGVVTATFGVLMVLLPLGGLLALDTLVGAYSFCFGLLLAVVELRLRTRWPARQATSH
jgi:uncharacterized membrane protein HdeD (DUF308 family)